MDIAYIEVLIFNLAHQIYLIEFERKDYDNNLAREICNTDKCILNGMLNA